MSEVTEPPTSEFLKTRPATEQIYESVSSLADRLTGWVDAQGWVADSMNHAIAICILFALLLLASALLFLGLRPIVLNAVSRLARKTEFGWDNDLVENGVFRWLTHLFPAAFICLVSPGLFGSAPWLAKLLQLSSSIYILLASFFVFDSLLNSLQTIFARTAAGKRINLSTFTQVAKLVGVLVVIILTGAILLGKSPLALIGGLGVFASVFMLVFKDVILGFVAGIQLACNRMLSQGDWLEMPGYSADGSVLEIGLTTVKVQNWDMTITTIPTYALISDSFKNWQGMSEGGGRRIKRSLLVDTNTVCLCSDEMLDRFQEIEHIADYLKRKKEEINDENQKLDERRRGNRVNGRRLTNVGTFRAYIEAYLKHHPEINQDMTCLVRQLAPDGRGLPIEIYCFSLNKNWAPYESIQADIFDHLLAVAQEFDLRVFQEPTGVDFRGSSGESVNRLGR